MRLKTKKGGIAYIAEDFFKMKGGPLSNFGLDPKTYLAFKGKGKTLNNMGAEVEAETFFSDYKKVDGIMVAHTLVSYQEGEEFMTMTITDVEELKRAMAEPEKYRQLRVRMGGWSAYFCMLGRDQQLIQIKRGEQGLI